MRTTFTIVLILFGCINTDVEAQIALILEKSNSARTEKLYPGNYIQYRLVDDEQWYGDHIYDLREDIQAIVFQDRFVPITDIAMIRQGRPTARNLGLTLTTFGLSWSGFAAIGTATDGNPDTRYRTSDAIVTGVAAGIGLLLPTAFGTRRRKLGPDKKYRLRVVDITF